jgi:hypothetical protein
MDCIFSASQITEKHREFNIPKYIVFIDFKKSFDSVDGDKLWTIMLSSSPSLGFDVSLETALCKNLPAENAQRQLSRPKPTKVVVPTEEEVYVK